MQGRGRAFTLGFVFAAVMMVGPRARADDAPAPSSSAPAPDLPDRGPPPPDPLDALDAPDEGEAKDDVDERARAATGDDEPAAPAAPSSSRVTDAAASDTSPSSPAPAAPSSSPPPEGDEAPVDEVMPPFASAATSLVELEAAMDALPASPLLVGGVTGALVAGAPLVCLGCTAFTLIALGQVPGSSVEAYPGRALGCGAWSAPFFIAAGFTTPCGALAGTAVGSVLANASALPVLAELSLLLGETVLGTADASVLAWSLVGLVPLVAATVLQVVALGAMMVLVSSFNSPVAYLGSVARRFYALPWEVQGAIWGATFLVPALVAASALPVSVVGMWLAFPEEGDAADPAVDDDARPAAE